MTNSLPIAVTLAGVVAALSPMALRYVHLDGLQMAAASYGVSLLIAVAAGLATGQLHPNTASLLSVLAGSGAFWSIQQAAFKVLYNANPAVVNPPVPKVVSGGSGNHTPPQVTEIRKGMYYSGAETPTVPPPRAPSPPPPAPAAPAPEVSSGGG